jgi:integrase
MFQISYHEGSARKRRLFGTLEKAKSEAKIAAETINDGRACSIEITGADRDKYLYAITKLEPLKIGISTAIEEYVEAKTLASEIPLRAAVQFYTDHHRRGLPARRVEEVVTELLEARQRDGVSKRHLDDIRLRLNRFSKDFQVQISKIQSSEVNTWLRGLKVATRTRNNFRGAISNLFGFAKESGYLSPNLPTPIDLVKYVKPKYTRPGIFLAGQIHDLLRNCKDDELNPLKPWIVLGSFCGLRSAEVFNLKWEDIRWDQNDIAVGHENKTGYRFAPLPANAKAWLRKFQGRTGKIYPLREMPYERLRALCKAANVTLPENGFRHSFGTYRTAAIKNVPQVSIEMGNSVQVVNRSYNAVVPESEGLAWFQILPTSKS